MRTILVVFTIALSFHTVHAQWLTKSRVQNNQNYDKAPVSWGYYFGVNSFDYNFDYKEDRPDIQVERSIGFNVGLVGNLRINDYIDLRTEPGLVYTQRNLMYAPDPRFERESDLLREVPSTYIYAPLSVRFNTKRLNNFRPFISAGVATAINLSSNEDNPDDNFAGKFEII